MQTTNAQKNDHSRALRRSSAFAAVAIFLLLTGVLAGCIATISEKGPTKESGTGDDDEPGPGITDEPSTRADLYPGTTDDWRSYFLPTVNGSWVGRDVQMLAPDRDIFLCPGVEHNPGPMFPDHDTSDHKWWTYTQIFGPEMYQAHRDGELTCDQSSSVPPENEGSPRYSAGIEINLEVFSAPQEFDFKAQALTVEDCWGFDVFANEPRIMTVAHLIIHGDDGPTMAVIDDVERRTEADRIVVADNLLQMLQEKDDGWESLCA